MRCSRCGHENTDDARFCGECGEPQQEERLEPGPYRPSEGAAGPGSPPPSGSVAGPSDIPPRDLGQLIGETFSTYGKAVVPLFVIAIIPQIPSMLSIALGSGDPIDDPASVGYSSGDLVLALIGFLLGIPSAAAAVFCVGRVLTGRKADVVTCYYRAFSVLIPSVVVTIIITLALVASAILMLIIIGIPLFFYLLVVWFFAIPAVVIEGRDGISALNRSRELTLRSWWRLFGIGVVYMLIFIALAIPGGIVSAILGFVRPELFAIGLGVTVALVLSVYYVSSVLVYLDLRVRKESYSLQALADDLARRPGQLRR